MIRTSEVVTNKGNTSGSIHTDYGIYADFCGYFPVEKPNTRYSSAIKDRKFRFPEEVWQDKHLERLQNR